MVLPLITAFLAPRSPYAITSKTRTAMFHLRVATLHSYGTRLPPRSGPMGQADKGAQYFGSVLSVSYVRRATTLPCPLNPRNTTPLKFAS